MCFALCVGGGHWTHCILPKGHTAHNHRDGLWLPVTSPKQKGSDVDLNVP